MNGVVDSGGVEIAWQSWGPPTAETIVFSHSLGSDRSMWAPQIEDLAVDHRVITVDTRGHGRSAAPPGRYSLDVLARDVLAAAEAAGADRFHLCGLSMGGQIALWSAIHRPDRLVSVIACNTAAKVGTPELWNTRIGAVRQVGMAGIRDAVIERWFAPDFGRRHPDWLTRAERVFDSTSADGYAGCCAALADADLREAIDAIEVPTLIIGGALDQATPPEEAHTLHRRIGHSELTVFDGAAHLSNLDVSGPFTARVRAFVSSSN